MVLTDNLFHAMEPQRPSIWGFERGLQDLFGRTRVAAMIGDLDAKLVRNSAPLYGRVADRPASTIFLPAMKNRRVAQADTQSLISILGRPAKTFGGARTCCKDHASAV